MPTIHFVGDSISRGWALGAFEGETLDPAHPLFKLRSLWSTAQLVLPTGAAYGGPAMGDPAAASYLEAKIAAGRIRAGDVVVFEDAGPHGGDPSAYQARWEGLRQAVTGKRDITCVMMTMFDYAPAAADSQYDRVIGARTMNDATRAAAAATSFPTVGPTILVDMNAAIDSWHSATLTARSVPSMHPDGIHPNVWGQTYMLGEILRATGLDLWITDTGPVRSLCAANWQFLGYGTTDTRWSDGTAAVWADHCLRKA